MSMFIFFKRDHDGHKAGKEYLVERSLARRLCENNVAVPLSKHLRDEQIKKELEKKEQLLEDKENTEKEKAISIKANNRSKTIKK